MQRMHESSSTKDGRFRKHRLKMQKRLCIVINTMLLAAAAAATAAHLSTDRTLLRNGTGPGSSSILFHLHLHLEGFVGVGRFSSLFADTID